MEERFDELKTRLAEIHDLRGSLEMLFWDQTVMMPPGGGPVRGQQLTTLDKIAHEKFVSDDIGVLIHRRRRRLLRGRDGPGVRVRPGVLVPAAARGVPFDRHPDQGDHPQPAIDRGGLRAARPGLPGGLGRRHPERETRRHRVVRPDLHLHDPVRPVDGLPRLHPHPDQGGSGPRAQFRRRGGAWHLDHSGHRHERRRDRWSRCSPCS